MYTLQTINKYTENAIMKSYNTEDKSYIDPTNWFAFDGFEYRCVANFDSTYRIIDEQGEVVADGVLLLSDDPFDDAIHAIVNAIEGDS